MVYFLVCVHSCKTKVNYSSRMPPEMSALLVIKWTTEIVRLWGWVTIQNLSWLFKNDIIALISFRLNSGRWIAYDERHDLQDSLPSCMRYSEKQFHRKTVEISWITERKKSLLLIERQNVIYIDLLNYLFLAEQLFWNTADDDVKQHTQ